MSRWTDVEQTRLDIAEAVGNGETDIIQALRETKRRRWGDA